MRPHREHTSILVICATIVGQAVVPLVGGKGHCTGRQTTSHKHWRYGTTRVCCSGWRSPLLTGAAWLARIFLLDPRVPWVAASIDFLEPPQGELRRIYLPRTWVNRPVVCRALPHPGTNSRCSAEDQAAHGQVGNKADQKVP